MDTEPGNKRIVISRLVFIFIFIFLLFRFFLHVTPSHFLQPSLFLLNLDLTYWLYKYSRIANLIIYNQTGAVLFDIFLFASCLLCIVFPLKRLFIILFSTLFFIYAITYNTFIVHHSHPLSIMMLITLPFWFKDNERWKLMWEGARYYVCYVYVMSFISKVWLGNAFFYWNQGIGSVKKNLVEYMYHYPDTFTSVFYRFFISHPLFLNIGNNFIFLLEGFMLTGFLTKKYDPVLLCIPVIIHLCTYVFADVFFIEMLVLVFVFFSKQQTEIIAKRIPVILK